MLPRCKNRGNHVNSYRPPGFSSKRNNTCNTFKAVSKYSRLSQLLRVEASAKKEERGRCVDSEGDGDQLQLFSRDLYTNLTRANTAAILYYQLNPIPILLSQEFSSHIKHQFTPTVRTFPVHQLHCQL